MTSDIQKNNKLICTQFISSSNDTIRCSVLHIHITLTHRVIYVYQHVGIMKGQMFRSGHWVSWRLALLQHANGPLSAPWSPLESK